MRELFAFESKDSMPYPEGRNPWGLSDTSVGGPILMSEQELQFLLDVLPNKGLYLEIGTWTAAGLGWIADRKPGLHCVGVDCFEGPPTRRLWFALGNWEQRPNVDLYLGRVENLRWREGSCDVVLVDGDHTGEAVARDLSIADDLVKGGGVILAHDYGRLEDHPEVTPAVDAFCAEHGYVIEQRADSLVLLRWHQPEDRG